MTDTLLGLDLAELKNLFRATRASLEVAEFDPGLDKRALYKELKALQYEISMREATSVAAQEA